MPPRLDPPALPGWEPAFAAVKEQSRQRGLRALVVGGYVRDRLLGGERASQIREVDILVEGQGAIELATAVISTWMTMRWSSCPVASSATTRPAESPTSVPGP